MFTEPSVPDREEAIKRKTMSRRPAVSRVFMERSISQLIIVI
jgi:hypothetical protein